MDPLSSIQTIFSIIISIQRLAENVKANSRKCHSLAERVKCLNGPLQKLKTHIESNRAAGEQSKPSLANLLDALRKAEALILSYSNESWLKKALHQGTRREEFAEINQRIGMLVQSLHFDISVDTFVNPQRDQSDENSDRQALELLKKFERENQMLMNQVTENNQLIRNFGTILDDINGQLRHMKAAAPQAAQVPPQYSPPQYSPPQHYPPQYSPPQYAPPHAGFQIAPPPIPYGFQTYIHPFNRWRIGYPGDWEMMEKGEFSFFFVPAFIAQAANSINRMNPPFRENFNIFIEQLAGSITLEDYMVQSVLGLPTVAHNFQMLSTKVLQMQGQPAAELVYTGWSPHANQQLQWKQIIGIYNNRAFIFTFTSRPHQFQQWNSVIESMMNTWGLL